LTPAHRRASECLDAETAGNYAQTEVKSIHKGPDGALPRLRNGA
jgi:hypothetical protein